MNSQEKDQIAKNVFEQCFHIRPNEAVLIVTDQGKHAEANLFLELAKRYTPHVEVIELQGMTENAQEPPAAVTKKLSQADIALLVTTLSLSHTTAREEASKAGTRIASLPGITLDMIERTLSSNYQKIAAQSEAVAQILNAGKEVQITSPGGTNLRLSIADRTAIADAGQLSEQGAFSNLPAGESFLAPVEETAEGTLVFDGSIADIQLDEPVKIRIKHGKAVEVSGKNAAQELLSAMKSVGEGAFQVAELGIGTNPQALVESDILEAEKVLGTCHIAFGNNIHFGGRIDVPFHTDGLILSPTVLVDGKAVVQDGVLTVT